MKQTQLLTALCLTAGVFTLSACGGGDKPADAPKPAADASKPADTAPPPMIDTIKKIKDTGKVVLGNRESSIPHSYLVDGNRLYCRLVYAASHPFGSLYLCFGR